MNTNLNSRKEIYKALGSTEVSDSPFYLMLHCFPYFIPVQDAKYSESDGEKQ
jgi:hypothetical protein